MLWTRRFIYLAIIVMFALATEVYLASSQGYWVLWSALLLSLMIVGHQYYQRVLSVLFTGVIAAVLVVVANLTSLNTFTVMALLGLVTFTVMLLAERKKEWFYPLLIINLMTLLSALLPFSTVASISRAYAVLLGTGIVMIGHLIFLPWFTKTEMRSSIMLLIQRLAYLTDDIFNCFLEPTYPDNLYLFERRLHVQKNCCMHLLQYISKMDKHNQYHEIQRSLDRMFELLLACALLRFRVTDHTIFGLSGAELADILSQIKQDLADMSYVFHHGGRLMNAQALQDKIAQFENTYQTVMQVTAPEPLVLLLFISNLRSLSDEFNHFYALNRVDEKEKPCAT